jgi:hypothetical protein
MSEKLEIRRAADGLWDLREQILPLYDKAIEALHEANIKAPWQEYAYIAPQRDSLLESMKEAVRLLGHAASSVDFASRRLSDFASQAEVEYAAAVRGDPRP